TDRGEGDRYHSVGAVVHRRHRPSDRLRRGALRPIHRTDAIVAAQRRGAEGRGFRYAAGARRHALEVDRRRHAQHDRLSREPQMSKRATVARGVSAASLIIGALLVGALPMILAGQSTTLSSDLLGKPPIDSWPTYHGDYSGRRYSTLKQINASNVKNLTLAWMYRANTSTPGAKTGGEGPEPTGPAANISIKSTPLMVNGVLYVASPDHVWAID